MNQQREELDEMIDRVAQAMTAVASEPALVDRVVGRLADLRASSLSWPRLVLVGAVVTMAAVTATLLTNGDRDAGETRAAVASPPAPAPTAPPLTSAAHGASAEPSASVTHVSPKSIPRSWRPAIRMITHIREVPELDPLASPVLLTVDELATVPLSVEPVAIEPLDVASLAAADDRDQPKE